MATDLNAIRKRLESDLQQLLSRVENIDNRLRQPGEQDWEEQATQRENDEVLETLEGQAAQEITQIREALQRLSAGKYGTCVHCGQPIAGERLQALPFATSCIACA